MHMTSILSTTKNRKFLYFCFRFPPLSHNYLSCLPPRLRFQVPPVVDLTSEMIVCLVVELNGFSQATRLLQSMFEAPTAAPHALRTLYPLPAPSIPVHFNNCPYHVTPASLRSNIINQPLTSKPHTALPPASFKCLYQHLILLPTISDCGTSRLLYPLPAPSIPVHFNNCPNHVTPARSNIIYQPLCCCC